MRNVNKKSGKLGRIFKRIMLIENSIGKKKISKKNGKNTLSRIGNETC